MTRQEFVKKWGMQPALSITPAVPMIDVSNQLITDLETLELEALKHLQHYHDTTVGLYVTDVPEKLAKRIYELVKNSKDGKSTDLIMIEQELTSGPLTWQLDSLFKSVNPNQLEVEFEEVKKKK
jgi:hypothetical protein